MHDDRRQSTCIMEIDRLIEIVAFAHGGHGPLFYGTTLRCAAGHQRQKLDNDDDANLAHDGNWWELF
ncbi:hypothetical protein [Pararhizobium sp. PWRC1-1]|uniref:hypothetical protein n=1 Tax=Pararhizobium sp. PWRC1-1 TaxID=2804566 RepID=UPI003CF44423